jgi:hypothetical protein
VRAVAARVERAAVSWPTDTEGFDAKIDGLIEAFPEQAENLRRLRHIAHEANATTDPAAHDRLEVEYDTIIELIDATDEATIDMTRAGQSVEAQ